MEVKTILKKYRLQLGFTFCLILLEAALSILFPLFIGYAIDGAINGIQDGALRLGLLGLAALIVGVGRRVFDSRLYAKIYQSIGASIITRMKDHSPSRKSARLSMIGELIEFFEDALPELISNVIGLVGVIAIIATLNLQLGYVSVGITAVIYGIYWFSSSTTMQLNASANDEFEKQVDLITKNDQQALNLHLKTMMKWNIKLSDLEATNFSISWIILMAFLVMSILLPISGGLVKYGTLFSLIMYVFQYIENVVNLPLFYQNWLRLREIKERLKDA